MSHADVEGVHVLALRSPCCEGVLGVLASCCTWPWRVVAAFLIYMLYGVTMAL